MAFDKTLRKLGLSTKIILVTTFAIILTAIVGSGFFYIRTKTIVFENLQKRGGTICDNLSFSAKYGVLTEDTEILNELIEGVMQAEDVVYVTIQNDHGKVLAGKTTVTLPDMINLRKKALRGEKCEITLTYDSLANPIYNFSSPIVAKKVTLEEMGAVEPDIEEQQPAPYLRGAVQIGLSLGGVLARLRNILRGIIILTMIIIGCGIIFSLSFVRIIMKPINQMAAAAANVASGDLSQKVRAESHDAIGQFANQFNIMTTALKERQEQLKNLAKFPSENPSPVLRIDQHGTILYTNEAGQLLLDKWDCRAGQPVPEHWRELITEVLQSKLNKITEIAIADRVFSLTVAPVAEAGYVNIYGQDITDRKHSEEALERSEQRYSLAQRAANIGSWDWNILTGALLWSERIEPMFGFEQGKFGATYEAFLDCVHPQDRQYVLDSVSACTEEGKDYAIEHRIIWPDGTIRWVSETGDVIRDKKSKAIRMIGIVQDITKRKQAEHALQESEERFRDFFENAPIGFHIFGPDRIIIDVNDAELKMIGYAREEIIGKKTWADLIVPEQKSEFEEHWQDIITKGEVRDLEYTLVHKDGRHVNVVLNASSRFDSYGNLINTRGSVLNITERKRAEQELREKEEKYRDLVETMNEGLGVADEKYMVTYVNKRFSEMLGYHPDEMLGHHLADFLDEQNKRIMKQQSAGRRRGQTKRYDLTWTDKNGQKIYTIVSPKGIFDTQGNFQGSLGVITDITRRKRVENEREYLLKTLELKNEELESILYVASHDLRSALVNIQGFSHELSDNCDLLSSTLQGQVEAGTVAKEISAVLNKGIPEALSFILASANKMDALLSGLLRLSRLGSEAMRIQRLNMNKMLADVTRSMEYQIKEAAVTLKIKRLPPCSGDASQINQVFSNLLDNAIKYLDNSRPGVIRISGEIKDNHSVYCVEDNGTGIATAYQDKIFEMFHQLEPEKRTGEGLGLTIVRRIIDRHNGKIWVESEPAKGSKFYVSLPTG